MPDFPHLSLPTRVDGLYNSPYGPGKKSVNNKKSERTKINLENRVQHGESLKESSDKILNQWRQVRNNREEDAPEIPESIPLFLQVDPKVFQSDQLFSFGIDVVSEKENGFIIGASQDVDLGKLKEKIDKFIENRAKSGKPAELWQINEGLQWRIDEILSSELLEKWPTITDDEILLVEISVACHVKVGEFPKKDNKTDDEFNRAVERWQARKNDKEVLRDKLAIQRENEIEEFTQIYSGEVLDIIDFSDSYTFQIKISGKGLKDLVSNYPYLFEVAESEIIEGIHQSQMDYPTDINLEITPPDKTAPKVCIIDSGIQENHVLLRGAVDSINSKSYLPNNNLTADQVPQGGHGTRVAGEVLYFENKPRSGTFTPRLILQNARILDEGNQLPTQLYPPTLMGTVVSDYLQIGTRLFNLSVNSSAPCRSTYMSSWAAMIDRIMYDHDVLFLISAGNISTDTIRLAINSGKNYPTYLLDNSCRIANPAQSSLAIAVGSICREKFLDEYVESFGAEGEISSFSRIGLGMWGGIKPDVVEYGGDFIRERAGSDVLISNNSECCPELVTSVYDGHSPALNKDRVGTSFSTPKVAHIAASIQSILPNSGSLLYKALIIQSARWPEIANRNPNKLDVLRQIGYGLPSLERATQNSQYRISLVYEGVLFPKRADVFNVKIPEEIRRIGDEFDILIEVTLSFKAKPRRTRRYLYSYLSGYLQWESSQLGEAFGVFRERIIKSTEEDGPGEQDTTNNYISIPWTINSRSNAGINGVKLNYSSTQKDWAIVKSHQLTDDFGIGIIGRAGWEKDLNEEIPYALVVSFEAVNRDVLIYERVRIANEIEISQEVRI